MNPAGAARGDGVVSSMSSRVRLLTTVFVVLFVVDAVRLYVVRMLGASTDAFEAVVVGICMVVALRAAFRSQRQERTLWAFVAAFFFLLLAADLHDFTVTVGRSSSHGLAFLEMLGWMAYLPLAVLCVAPMSDGNDTSTSRTVSLLDFTQATLVLVVTYYTYDYLPHAATHTTWQAYGRADVVRDAILSLALLFRAAVDVRRGPRAIFGIVGGAFLLRLFSRIFFNPMFPLDALVRPVAYMLIAIGAERWYARSDDEVSSGWREVASRSLLAVAPAAGPALVGILAARHPGDRVSLWSLFWVSLAIFVVRTAIAEYERWVSARQRDAHVRRIAEAESRFRALGEHAPIGIAVVLDGVVAYANAAFGRIAATTPEELIGSDPLALVHPEDRHRAAISMRRVLSGTRAVSGEIRALQANGETRHLTVLGAAAPIDGSVAAIVQALDVTEARKAQDELRRTAAELRRILDNFVDAFLQTDRNGRLTLVSPSAARMFGYDSAEDMIGIGGASLCADPQLRAEMLAEARVAGSIIDREALGVRRDGTPFWVSLSLKPFLDENGEPVGTHGVIRDISERKSAEERSLLLSVMLDEAPAGIVIHDEKGRFLYANKGANALHGYSAGAFMRLGVGDMVAPGEVAAMRGRRDEVRAHGGGTFQLDLARSDGSLFPAEIRAKRVEWMGLPAVLSVETDLTEPRRAAASRAASERLAQATIDALRAHVCVLDADGMILAINRAWRQFADRNPPAPTDAFLGANYLTVCDRAEGAGSDEAAPFAAGVRAVIAGERDHFIMEYPCHAPGEERWFAASVTRFAGGEPVRVVIAHSEITKRRRAENALRASEEQYRTLIQHLHAGVVVHAGDTAIMLANSQACRMLGLTSDSITGKTAGDPAWQFLREDGSVMPGEEFPVNRVLATRSPVESLIVGIERPIGRSWALVNAFPECDAQRNITQIVVTFVDITEQHEARTRLTASETRLAAALDVAELGAYEYGENFRLISIDDRTRAILGLEGIENTREVWGQRIAPQDLPRINEIANEVEEGPLDHANIEYRYDHPTRGQLWIRHTVAVLGRDADGRMNAQVGVVSDITRHKRADDDLRATQERFAAFMSNLPAAAFVQDSSGRTLFANAYLESEVGLKRWSRRRAAALAGDDVKKVLHGPMKISDSLADARGAMRVFETILFPIVVQAGEVLIGGISIDVTERNALEAQLLHAQKLEAVGRLASGIAHDFNNILQAMMMTSQVLQVRDRDNEKVRTAVGEYEALIRRATALTRQLLLFSRQDPAKHRMLDVVVLVQDLMRMLRRLVRENVTFAVELSSEAQMVDADPTQLDQVITNLVVNAVDAMPNGGKLTLRVGASGADRVVLEVEDTGHGIPDALYSRLFEPFFTTKSAGQGTGLGLAVVHGIVTAHGGTIEVASRVGEGTTFRILLPRAPETAPARPEPALEIEPGAAHGERILVVEDNAPARETMSELLTTVGYDVVAVGSAEEALRLPADRPFYLLLSDMVLPGKSGLALSKDLSACWPEMAFILMSGYIDEEVKRTAINGNTLRFLQKPFDIATLLQEITRTLGDARRGGAH